MEAPLQFKLLEFNRRRKARGAEAARVEVIDGDETYWLWMSAADLRKNMAAHGDHPELSLALSHYEGFDLSPAATAYQYAPAPADFKEFDRKVLAAVIATAKVEA